MSKILEELAVIDAIARLPSSAILKPEEAAVFLRVSAKTLERYRSESSGPVYVQNNQENSIGANRSVRYRKEDLEAWVLSQRVESTVHAAAVRGQMFSSIHDLVNDIPVWMGTTGLVDGLVEKTDVSILIERIQQQIFSIEFIEPFELLRSRWSCERSRGDYFKTLSGLLFDLKSRSESFFNEGTLMREMGLFREPPQ